MLQTEESLNNIFRMEGGFVTVHLEYGLFNSSPLLTEVFLTDRAITVKREVRRKILTLSFSYV